MHESHELYDRGMGGVLQQRILAAAVCRFRVVGGAFQAALRRAACPVGGGKTNTTQPALRIGAWQRISRKRSCRSAHGKPQRVEDRGGNAPTDAKTVRKAMEAGWNILGKRLNPLLGSRERPLMPRHSIPVGAFSSPCPQAARPGARPRRCP